MAWVPRVGRPSPADLFALHPPHRASSTHTQTASAAGTHEYERRPGGIADSRCAAARRDSYDIDEGDLQVPTSRATTPSSSQSEDELPLPFSTCRFTLHLRAHGGLQPGATPACPHSYVVTCHVPERTRFIGALMRKHTRSATVKLPASTLPCHDSGITEFSAAAECHNESSMHERLDRGAACRIGEAAPTRDALQPTEPDIARNEALVDASSHSRALLVQPPTGALENDGVVYMGIAWTSPERTAGREGSPGAASWTPRLADCRPVEASRPEEESQKPAQDSAKPIRVAQTALRDASAEHTLNNQGSGSAPGQLAPRAARRNRRKAQLTSEQPRVSRSKHADVVGQARAEQRAKRGKGPRASSAGGSVPPAHMPAPSSSLRVSGTVGWSQRGNRFVGMSGGAVAALSTATTRQVLRDAAEPAAAPCWLLTSSTEDATSNTARGEADAVAKYVCTAAAKSLRHYGHAPDMSLRALERMTFTHSSSQ